MIRNKDIKTILCAFLISLVLGASATVALAYESASSNNYYYGPINGYAYHNWATVWSNNGMSASTTVTLDSGGDQVPVGYMGIKCRLYNMDGTLLDQTSWSFNSSACASFGTGTYSFNTDEYCYSQGRTAAYNGNGYNYYDTYQSPYLN